MKTNPMLCAVFALAPLGFQSLKLLSVSGSPGKCPTSSPSTVAVTPGVSLRGAWRRWMCLATLAAKDPFLIPDPNLPPAAWESCWHFMAMRSFGAFEPQPGEKRFWGWQVLSVSVFALSQMIFKVCSNPNHSMTLRSLQQGKF